MIYPKGFPMLVTTYAVPNASPFQSGASNSAKTSNETGIAVCQAHARCHHDSVQKPEHKAISDYRVRQLAGDALQTGRKLVRSAVHFAFSQVMSSPYIGAVAPGLKETLLGLAVLYNQQQSAAACPSNEFPCNNGRCLSRNDQCDGLYDCCGEPEDCDDQSDEQGCTQEKCTELGRFICNNGKCLDYEDVCDGFNNDCGDNSDEREDLCGPTTNPTTSPTTSPITNPITSPATNPTTNPATSPATCASGQFLCDTSKCIKPDWLCDGILDCIDRSDEQGCTQEKCEELGRGFLCDGSACIDPDWQCDGDSDCIDRLDEQGCTQDKCAELGRGLLCDNSTCIEPDLQCDGDPGLSYR
ncbi:LDL receptor domain-containing protein [Endozoicomonas sp. SCSIO W0465]|uniref:LDL receptor domain-containing protein n=1 Tax=Endozoicomonas sp. SCSIO W0465 TaxID=2918516 RepID=UPI002076060B|nr:LDL receptor domain-containing protein [Endozoicomonas sp. SCSIO W0465]USE37345.1 LDL receptor domain-containing protein [Endozoicomonas sp. SCSIO W0465]